MTNAQRHKAYRFGLAAEKYAAWYLRCKGYRIVAERYRNAQGEIDLLARRGNMLVAVEVKARKTLGECAQSVPVLKQQKINRAMQGLLMGAHGIAALAGSANRDIRFDVVWIVPWHWPRHIPDAWRM